MGKVKKTNIYTPWERQAGETEKAYLAFCQYRDTPQGERSVRQLAAKAGVRSKVWHGWSSKYSWVARAAAWDDWLDSLRRRETENAVKRAARRHIRLSRQLQELAGVELVKLADRSEKGDVPVMRARDIPRALDVSVKLERLAMGEATDRVEGKLDFSKLSMDELQELKALMNKAKKG